MLEKEVEDHLVKGVKRMGGLAYKFSSPGKRSVPDRVCVFPTGYVCFVELKRPGKTATPSQEKVLKNIRARGVIAVVIDHPNRVDAFLQWVQTKINARKALLRV